MPREEGTAVLLQAMCAWDALLAHASGCIRFNELEESIVRRTLEGIIGSISVHPDDVKQVAVAVMLYMMDSTLVRKRLTSLTDWEKPLILELLGTHAHPATTTTIRAWPTVPTLNIRKGIAVKSTVRSLVRVVRVVDDTRNASDPSGPSDPRRTVRTGAAASR
jgi:hypothetical protein